MNGSEIAQLIYDWAEKNDLNADDFDVISAQDLLENLEYDKNRDYAQEFSERIIASHKMEQPKTKK
jgi:hypothetical protein